MLLTFSDVTHHLAAQIGQVLSGPLEMKVRTAVNSAWGRLMDLDRWRYYHRQGSLIIQACQTTGSIEFDYATQTVTLSDATWPTDAADQHIRLGNSWFPVKQRVSDTEILLYENQHPSTDLDPSTAYWLQKVQHPLPVEVGDIVQIIDPTQSVTLSQLDLVDTMVLSEAFGQYSQPVSFTLIQDPRIQGKWCLWIPSIVTTPTTLQYLYVARRPEKTIPTESAGQVSLSSGTATFTDAVVRTWWEGAVLRISNNDQFPTSEYGNLSNQGGLTNTDVTETIITEYINPTSCKVRDILSSSTSKPYEVSSHIDVRKGAMETLMLRIAEQEFGIRPNASHMEGFTSEKRVRQALLEAMETDSICFSGLRSNMLPAWYRLRLQDLSGGTI